jgi:hypothetical protein
MDETYFEKIITKINKYGYYDDLLINSKTVMNIMDITDIDKLKKMIDRQILFIEKSMKTFKEKYKFAFVYKPDVLVEKEMIFLDNFINKKINDIKLVLNKLLLSDIRDVHDYLNSLIKILENIHDPLSCNIISLYLQYSHLIHLLVSLDKQNILAIDDRDMFSNSDLNFSKNFIFTRCFASANTLKFLLGGKLDVVSIPIKYDDLIDLIKRLRTVPAYYLDIGIGAIIRDSVNEAPDSYNNWSSNFNHIFAIIKYQDENGTDYYYLTQSYFYQYCPIAKKYNINEINTLIRDIQSIYFNYNGVPRTGFWNKSDNNIWGKYFGDATEFIRKKFRNDELIKLPEKCIGNNNCYCFEYRYNAIDSDNCYNNLISLLQNSEENVINCLDNICRNILILFDINQYERAFIIKSIKSGEFVDVIKSKNGWDKGIKLNKNVTNRYNVKEYVNDIDWRSFNKILTSTNTNSEFITDKFKINSYDECIIFLKVLVQFFELKYKIRGKTNYSNPKTNFLITNHTGGKSNIKYQNRYIKNKTNYLMLNV